MVIDLAAQRRRRVTLRRFLRQLRAMMGAPEREPRTLRPGLGISRMTTAPESFASNVPTLYSGTKNASSWAMRAWLALREAGIEFERMW